MGPTCASGLRPSHISTHPRISAPEAARDQASDRGAARAAAQAGTLQTYSRPHRSGVMRMNPPVAHDPIVNARTRRIAHVAWGAHVYTWGRYFYLKFGSPGPLGRGCRQAQVVWSGATLLGVDAGALLTGRRRGGKGPLALSARPGWRQAT